MRGANFSDKYLRPNLYQIWSLSRGKLLRDIVFPSVIEAIALDPGEHVFYAGGRDGKIYIAALNAQVNSSSTYGMHIIGTLSEQRFCSSFCFD